MALSDLMVSGYPASLNESKPLIASLRLRIEGLEAAAVQVMRDHRAQLRSEAADLGCSCPQCRRFRQLGLSL